MSGVLSVPVGWAKIKAKNKLPTAIKMKTDLANEEVSFLTPCFFPRLLLAIVRSKRISGIAL